MTAPHTPIGSRRTYEVCPARYSPADRPSSIRAAPAKNRIWSTMGGISSDSVRANGLPVFCALGRTSSSARASRASAIRKQGQAPLRRGGALPAGEGLGRARTARSTSAGPETGASAKGSPVLGSIDRRRRPVLGVDQLAADEVLQPPQSTNLPVRPLRPPAIDP